MIRSRSRSCRVRTGGVALLAALAFALLASPVLAEKPKARVALFSWPGYGFWFVAKEKGLGEVELDITIIEDPYESFALMAADQLDAVSSTIEYGPIGAHSDNPARIVAYANSTYGSDKIIVGPGIDDPKQLKGKKVAVLEGGLSQIYMGIYLERNGLKFDDVTYVNLIADDAAAAMIGGDVAAGEFWEPYGGQVLANLEGSKLVDQTKDEYWLKSGLISDAVFMSSKLIEKDPALAQKTLAAYYAGVDYWMKNPKEANEIISKALKFPMEDVVGVIGDSGRFADGGLWIYSLAESAAFMGAKAGDPPLGQSNGQIVPLWKLLNDWWVKFELIPAPQPIEKGVDTSVIQAIAK